MDGGLKAARLEQPETGDVPVSGAQWAARTSLVCIRAYHAGHLRRFHKSGVLVCSRFAIVCKALVLASVIFGASLVDAVRSNAAAGGSVVAKAAETRIEGGLTLFELELTDGVTVEVFTLADPYRVIIDLPDVNFRLPKTAGRSGRGLVKSFRYGLFAEGKGRVVIDTDGPVWIEAADMTRVPGQNAVRLVLALKRTDAAAFGRGTGAQQALERQAAETARGEAEDEAAALSAKANAKPVVVIDPGHGGLDPGAVAPGPVLEKSIVLDVARLVVRRLQSKDRYDVRVTRSRDVFVSLDKRLSLSRGANADLFVSLHADSIGDQAFAERIRGATVYTLSAKASDKHARLMAEKENRADLLAGLPNIAKGYKREVTNILIDLMKRETAGYSAAFSQVLVKKLKGSVPVSRKPKRAAAFKVLKQTRTPSVLIELGYLSNASDRKMMQTKAWQNKVARAITAAIDTYFQRRTARLNQR